MEHDFEIMVDQGQTVVNYYRNFDLKYVGGNYLTSWRCEDPTGDDEQRVLDQLLKARYDLTGLVKGRQNDCFLDRSPFAYSFYRSWE